MTEIKQLTAETLLDIELGDEVQVILDFRNDEPMYDTATVLAPIYDEDENITDYVLDTDATGRKSEDWVLTEGTRLRRLSEFPKGFILID